MGRSINATPQKALSWAKIVKISQWVWDLCTIPRMKQKYSENAKICYVTCSPRPCTHVVAAPPEILCVVTSHRPTSLYVLSLIEICSGVSKPQVGRVEICHFSLLWLLAFITACTIVEAVMYIAEVAGMTLNEPNGLDAISYRDVYWSRDTVDVLGCCCCWRRRFGCTAVASYRWCAQRLSQLASQYNVPRSAGLRPTGIGVTSSSSSSNQ